MKHSDVFRRTVLMIFGSIVMTVSLFCTDGTRISVRHFGAKGDGTTLDTKAIQRAIDSCSGNRNVVYFESGTYVVGSLILKSGTEIYLAKGATILGSTNLADYESQKPSLQSYNDLFLRYSIFYAEKAQDITLRGEGSIDGRGGAFPVTTKKKPDRYTNRPFVIRFVECSDIHIEGLTLRNSAMWMQQYLACTNLVLRNLTIWNHANQNNDMMDIDGCKNVVIDHCSGDTDDDGITLKSTSQYKTENVMVTNCTVSSHCNALKLGTESSGGFQNIVFSNIKIQPSKSKSIIFGLPGGTSGITLASVDGGKLQHVVVSDITIDGPQVPICIRLGNRARKYKDDMPIPPVGSVQDISISHISVKNVGPIACSITGIPGFPVENICIQDVHLDLPGGIQIDSTMKTIPELENAYPEGTMWGNLPASGVYVRHARGVILSRIDLSFRKKDQRPVIVLDDAQNVMIDQFTAKGRGTVKSSIDLTHSNDVTITRSAMKDSAECFARIRDIDSGKVFLLDNETKAAQHAVISPNKEQVTIKQTPRETHPASKKNK